jgi:hypothetical protein
VAYLASVTVPAARLKPVSVGATIVQKKASPGAGPSSVSRVQDPQVVHILRDAMQAGAVKFVRRG